MNLRTVSLVFSCLFIGAFPAAAEPVQLTDAPQESEQHNIEITAHRIHLGALVPGLSGTLGAIDLGPAPPPGKTVFLEKKELESRLRSLGIATSRLQLPTGIRVRSAARRYTPQELVSRLEPVINSSLPVGVTLEELRIRPGKVLSPEIRFGRIRMPQFRPREGRQSQVATAEVLWGERVVLRLPVHLKVHVDREAFRQIVPRGSLITVVIRRGLVEITASAETLAEASVGESVNLKVGSTRKVLGARLVDTGRAVLELR
ncbi:MAG: flagella basal body P-ring formation protein FlgA [Polyangiaceae bacterium]|nr:flagella basal body P-ring formation protein FlgA [Polyangiaceae bacterium]